MTSVMLQLLPKSIPPTFSILSKELHLMGRITMVEHQRKKSQLKYVASEVSNLYSQFEKKKLSKSIINFDEFK